MNDEDNTLYTYELIDWNTHPSVHVKLTKLTIHEAHTLNRALRMNRTTVRYDKQEPQESQQE